MRARVRSFVGRAEIQEPRGPVRGRRPSRLRSLDGEAGAGEAPGPAVEGAAALLHPQPDRGEVGERGEGGEAGGVNRGSAAVVATGNGRVEGFYRRERRRDRDRDRDRERAGDRP